VVKRFSCGGRLAARHRSRRAFQRYEQQLRPFIAGKQDAAVKFSGSFAPKTRLGIFLRNEITKAFELPFVAELAMGPSLMDRIDLPDYPVSADAGATTQ
jgi:2-polyprenyl-6-methoxyphenol hydroxylase-like FAD-dependent oxidoreductase